MIKSNMNFASFSEIADVRCGAVSEYAECSASAGSVPGVVLPEPILSVKQIKWLPNTCVYRRISEGKELKWWHHLVSGDPSCVHRAEISVRDKVVTGKYVAPKDVDVDLP